MKRLRNLLILILIVITFGTTRVNAESFVVGDKYTKDWKRSIGFTNYVDRNGNNKIIIEGLTIPKPINRGLTVIPYEITKVGTNNKILGYCIDPHLQSDTTYKIDYILGASKDKTNNAIGLGVLEIMKQGYSEFSGMPTISTSLSDRDFYALHRNFGHLFDQLESNVHRHIPILDHCSHKLSYNLSFCNFLLALQHQMLI